MAYYSLSQVVKMRRAALGHSRYEYDVEGPSAMTVYRMEEKGIRVSEKTYRKLTKVMGDEESTRRGLLKTKDIKVLWLMNEIENSFLLKDYEAVEELMVSLEERLDCTVKRNRQYLEFIKAKLQYRKGELDSREYEQAIRKGLFYGTIEPESLLERRWPFKEREWNQLLGVVEAIRRGKDYERQKCLLEQMKELIDTAYMEQEFKTVYKIGIRYFLGDILGNLTLHREAIELAEEAIKLSEDRWECRYLARLYYDIFWNYRMLKKKETLTEQEEARCKECLLHAYYLNKALHPENKRYEQKIRECYPEEWL